MSNSSIVITVDSIFNLASAILDILAVLICLTYLFVIIYRCVRIRRGRRMVAIDVPLILSINIICTIFIKSTLQITHVNFPTLMKDFQLNPAMTVFKETPLVRYRAYMLISITGILFWSYTLLAFFSFVRVIYPTKLWLHRSSLYLYILIPGHYICVFISLLPLLTIFDSLHEIPNEFYCGIASTPFYPSLYTTIISFALPVTVMCVFYRCIVRKMRETSVVRQNQELHQRDYIVIRRMSFNVVILNILSIPYIVMYIIATIENHYGSSLYRVQWISSSAGSFLFSLILPLISTRLRDFLRPNRLAPENNQNMP